MPGMWTWAVAGIQDAGAPGSMSAKVRTPSKIGIVMAKKIAMPPVLGTRRCANLIWPGTGAVSWALRWWLMRRTSAVAGSSSNGYWQPTFVVDESGVSSGFYTTQNGNRVVVADYYLRPPNRRFDTSVSGTYAVHVPAGQVRNIDAEAIAATVLFRGNE